MEHFDWYCVVILGTALSCVCLIMQIHLLIQEPVAWCASVITGGLAYLLLRVARRLK